MSTCHGIKFLFQQNKKFKNYEDCKIRNQMMRNSNMKALKKRCD